MRKLIHTAAVAILMLSAGTAMAQDKKADAENEIHQSGGSGELR